MKKNKYLFVLLLLISITVVCTCSTFFYVKLNNNQETANGDILVMTSCNPIYIATSNVLSGVDGYKVENLSQPTTGCLHDYTLTTEDMKKLSKADYLVVNGGGMEGYLEDVIAAYPDLKIIDTYEIAEESFLGGDSLLIVEDDAEEEEHHHEDEHESESQEEEEHEEHHHHEHGTNSHIWMDERIFELQVGAVAGAIDPNPNREDRPISNNMISYIDKLRADIDKQGADEKLFGQNVAVLHEAFAYTAQSLGANVVATMDLDEERQVSAGEVSDFLAEINEHNVKLVFAEYDYGSAMGKLIEEQTDAKVVYLETLVHGDYSSDDYVKVMNENYKKISDAL